VPFFFGARLADGHDLWDPQSDMFSALVGAVTALALFTRTQDRQIEAQPRA